MPSPLHLATPSGLRFAFNANGSLRRADVGDLTLNLFPGTEMDGGPWNVLVRCRGAAGAGWFPLLGPDSPAPAGREGDGVGGRGRRGDLAVRWRLTPAADRPAWFWHVELENTGAEPVVVDLLLCQDTGLAPWGAIRMNTHYVSQYIDHTPLEHARCGVMVASRQNQAVGGRFPWLLTGSLGRAVSHATDALDIHGLAVRAGAAPAAVTNGLPGRRRQHEHSMVALQDEAVTLAPGESIRRGFFACLVPDKPDATRPADAAEADAVLTLPEAAPPDLREGPAHAGAAPSLFTAAPLLAAVSPDEGDLTAWFGPERRHEEREQGALLSFFCGEDCHVATRAKELAVLRPHGHLIRTGRALVPDESALASTLWMGGVFHSMVTQGHVSINRLLSTRLTGLSLFRSHGQRVFAEIDGAWHLLDLPSAFAMTPAGARWFYRHAGGVIEVAAWADDSALQLRLTVREGTPCRFLISHHVALHGDDGIAAVPALCEPRDGGCFLRAVPDSDVGRRFPDGGFLVRPAEGTVWERTGDDALLFTDGVSRGQPFFCVVTAPAASAGLVIEGRLVLSDAQADRCGVLDGLATTVGVDLPATADAAAVAVAQAAEMMPWFIQNALVHYLSPRGLEQYSGGGWGTRDVCQGPVELLLALGRFAPVRDILTRVFRQQNPDGDWPQWFMFFERERGIRPGDSHGDIVFWPLLALGQYLGATGDAALLDEALPFFDPAGDAAAPHEPVRAHVARALDLMRTRVIPGTRLAAYGHGDWNDSLQPARPEMRERLCSAWTVTLHVQTLTTLADGLRRCGQDEVAAALLGEAEAILADFRRLLVVDGVVTGLAFFHEDGRTDFLLHPRDERTGLRFSLLPMMHAVINDLFTPDETAAHLDLIRRHLTGPDGAHLFDRPLAYHGGPMRLFQRAETASFFGREIGNMYMHAHLRWCEALAHAGDAEGFLAALALAVPVGLTDHVPSAARRQANCYYSSTDAAFLDRHEACAHYDRVAAGTVALEGGWRVYSSGAGIAVRLIVQCLLGLRFETDHLVLDPVLPGALDGLVVRTHLGGRSVRIVYHVGPRGCGVTAVTLDDRSLAFTRLPNACRPGPVRIPLAALTESAGEATLHVALG